MSAAKPIWVTSKWTAAELNKQTIAFRLPLKGGGIAQGIGELWVSSRKQDDWIAVLIVIEQPLERWKKRQTVFQISQRYVDQIELHPNQETAKYRLVVA